MVRRKTVKRPKQKRLPPGAAGSAVKDLKLHQRMSLLESKNHLLEERVAELEEYREGQRGFLVDLMFSMNAITTILTKHARMPRFLPDKGAKPEDVITYGKLIQHFAMVPVVGYPQLMSVKAAEMQKWKEDRKKLRPLDYEGITLQVVEWARKLEMEYEELEGYLAEEGVTLKDVIEMLGKEELVEDLTPEEEDVVKTNVEETIRKINARRNGEKPKQPTQEEIEKMSESELEEYLLSGGDDEPEEAHVG